MTMKEEKPRADIYTRITERIVADLKRGVRPWMRPWSAKNLSGHVTRPRRLNGEPYSGMNVILLWSEANRTLREDRRWPPRGDRSYTTSGEYVMQS